jgi:endoglucanase Acf2
MRAKDTPVGVGFIHYHIPQVLEQPRPCPVIGKDTNMEHIGVSKYYSGSFFYLRPLIIRGITIKSSEFTPFKETGAKELIKTTKLVLSQSLGREKIEGTAAGLGYHFLKHHDVIAQGLAAGTRG